MCNHNANRYSCHLIFIALEILKKSKRLFGISAIFDALLSCGGFVWNAVIFATKFVVFEVPLTDQLITSFCAGFFG